jgi:hypothetical protein
MSSILKVNTIQDTDGNNIINESGNVITIGASGDTITVPAGATVSGFTSAGIDDNATSVAITIDSNERVGIGTTSPANKLDVRIASDRGVFLEGSASQPVYLRSYQGATSFNLREVGLHGSNILFKTGDSSGTSSSERMFMDSNGQMTLLGSTTSFDTTGSRNGLQTYYETDSGIATIGSYSSGGSTTLNFHTSQAGGASTEKMRILNNGNVGIGETAPLGLLHVKSADSGATVNGVADELVLEGSGRSGMTILSGTSSIGTIGFGDSGNNIIGSINYNHNGNLLTFFTNDAERMRIDSSGNLFVATTTEASDDVGHALLANGAAYHTTDGTYAGLFNRKSSDGEIVQIRKDNTVVGTIGTRASSLIIGSGDTHIGFFDSANTGSTDAITPQNGTSGGRTNAIDLGNSSNTFKDLYLGGGVFLGGTGTANKLDDYEEGTWTPVFSSGTGGYNGSALSITTATYTKIGNQVNLYCSFAVTGGSSISVGDSLAFTGQPFTPATPFTQRMGVGSSNQSIGSNSVAVGIICATSTDPGTMRFVVSQVNGSVSATVQTHFNMKYPT